MSAVSNHNGTNTAAARMLQRNARESLIALAPEAIEALRSDLASPDPKIRQAAYSFVLARAVPVLKETPVKADMDPNEARAVDHLRALRARVASRDAADTALPVAAVYTLEKGANNQ
jgi:hypothetical protein